MFAGKLIMTCVLVSCPNNLLPYRKLVTGSSSFSEYEFADILDIVADATLERQ
jgi:hypothetical protein